VISDWWGEAPERPHGFCEAVDIQPEYGSSLGPSCAEPIQRWVRSGETCSLLGAWPHQSRITNHQSLLTLASHLEILLVRAERIPVVLPNNAFDFVGVAGFDGFENLTMFFLRVW